MKSMQLHVNSSWINEKLFQEANMTFVLVSYVVFLRLLVLLNGIQQKNSYIHDTCISDP